MFSDNTIQGASYDMESHIVHLKDNDYLKANGILNDPDVVNQALVISMLWKAKGETAHPDTSKLNWATSAPIKDLDLNPWSNNTKSFWHYTGSLTNPRCTEYVNWVIM
jgi:carbonic anhydrase